jgi:hypothetical protein
MLYWGDFLDFFTLKLLIEGSNLSIGKLLTDSMQSPCVSNVLSTDEAVLLAVLASPLGTTGVRGEILAFDGPLSLNLFPRSFVAESGGSETVGN